MELIIIIDDNALPLIMKSFGVEELGGQQKVDGLIRQIEKRLYGVILRQKRLDVYKEVEPASELIVAVKTEQV